MMVVTRIHPRKIHAVIAARRNESWRRYPSHVSGNEKDVLVALLLRFGM
jgi:hypothetical protein